MKIFTKLMAMIFIISGFTFAQSNHTITIDGTNDFNSTHENFTTSSSGYTDYFTWDANNIYFGISGTDVDTDGKVSFIYIDTDPTGSNGTTSSINWSVTHTLPFNADWAFAYKVQSGDDYWNLRKYNSGWQADQSYTGSVSLGTDYLEVSIPRSDIGSPSEIKIVVFMQDDDGGWTFSAAPHDAITDGSGSKTFAHYEGYTLSNGYNPNDDRAYDNILGTNKAYLSFDGGDYVRYADDSSLEDMNGKSNYTLEAWVYVASDAEDLCDIYRRSDQYVLYYRESTKSLGVGIYSGGWKYYHTTDNTLTTGTWHHIAVIRNNTLSHYFHIYIDGTDVIDGNYNAYALSSSNSYNLYIGNDGSSGHYFKGYIDEIRLKNVAEDPSNLHSSKTDNEYIKDANTAALFHFDEGTGNTTKSYASGNNADLGGTSHTSTAMPTWETDVTDIPYPVELKSFTATVKGNNVKLNWATATEVNNYGFEIQRSVINGQRSEFETIGFVQGHGNSNSTKYYSYIDNPFEKGSYSYRLKQIDLDGSFKYSEAVTVDLGAVNRFALKQNYPNPFNPTTEISFDVPKESRVKLSVYNALGQKVADLLNEKLSAGTHHVRFDGSNLTSGIYFYRMQSNGFTAIKKMILMK